MKKIDIVDVRYAIQSGVAYTIIGLGFVVSIGLIGLSIPVIISAFSKV